MARLGRVTDPEALDASEGSRGRLRIEVPGGWLEEGAELAVDVPKLLACDRCRGGGCDRCGKSGALRPPRTASPLRLHLPAECGKNVQLRLADPFADGSIDQLIVEIAAAGEASAGVRRVAALAKPRRRLRWQRPAAALVLVLVVALALILLR